MMVLFNIAAMVLAALLLLFMMLRTRCYDSPGWWLFRILACYALVCFVYLAYDTSIIGDNLPVRYMFIRFGCFALVAAMFLSWHLLSKQNEKATVQDFKTKLRNIFDQGVHND